MGEVIPLDEVAPSRKVDLYKISPVTATGLPPELLALSVFINWGYLPGHNTGDFKKCPIDASGSPKSYADSTMHKTLDDAINAQKVKSNFGVGISLLPNGLQIQPKNAPQPAWLWVLDLDGFVNFGGGEIDDEVRPICERFKSYEALSVSTTGAQIFFLSDKTPSTIPKIKFSPSKFAGVHPDIKKYQNRAIEIFSKGRFIALTGTPLFNGPLMPLRVIPSSEVDDALNWLSNMANPAGDNGSDTDTSRIEKSAFESIIGNKQYYSKLTPDSLALVLRYVDYETEEVWFYTATALARVYGEAGRSFFIKYSRGDYANRKYERFDIDEVNAKYDRVLNELSMRPDGYGIKNLVKRASEHKDWPKDVVLNYEDVFSKMFGQSNSIGPPLLHSAIDDENPLVSAPLNDKTAVVSPAPEANEEPEVTTTTDLAVADLNKQWFVSVESGNTRIFRESINVELGVPTLEAFSSQDFKTLYANKTILTIGARGKPQTVGLADYWLKSPQRRQYEGGLALLPGSSAPSGVYNLWRGWGIEPLAGNAKPALRHLFFVICGGNRTAFKYLIRWMARAVQYPAKPAEVAVVMRGSRGTGKGTAGRWLLRMFGSHGMHIFQTKHLTGNFNAHLRSACFLFADEAFYAGDKSGEAVLKGLVTEEEIVIERKGVDAFTARNRLKIMMASNSEWVVPAGFDERRFLVLDVSDAQKQDHGYFRHLKAHMDNGGLSALLHHLLKLDISNFNIRSVPNTAGLDQQKLRSLTPFMAWLHECLYSGTLTGELDEWKTEVSRFWVTNNFEIYVQKRRLSYVNTGNHAVGRGLKEVFPTLGTVRRRTNSGKSRERHWLVPPLDEARGQFEKYLGLGNIDWPNED